MALMLVALNAHCGMVATVNCDLKFITEIRLVCWLVVVFCNFAV